MGLILPAVVKQAGGAGVTGVLLEPCHPEFPVSYDHKMAALHQKHQWGFFFIASRAILFPNKRGH